MNVAPLEGVVELEGDGGQGVDGADHVDEDLTHDVARQTEEAVHLVMLMEDFLLSIQRIQPEIQGADTARKPNIRQISFATSVSLLDLSIVLFVVSCHLSHEYTDSQTHTHTHIYIYQGSTLVLAPLPRASRICKL